MLMINQCTSSQRKMCHVPISIAFALQQTESGWTTVGGGIRNDFSHQYVKKYERISSEYGSGQAAIARNAIVESNQQIY